MYKLNTGRTFSRDVTIIHPGENNQDQRHSIRVEYEAVGEDEMESMRDWSKQAFLKRVVKGVSGVQDQNGKDIPAEKARELILSDPFAPSAIEADYLECTHFKNFRNRKSR